MYSLLRVSLYIASICCMGLGEGINRPPAPFNLNPVYHVHHVRVRCCSLTKTGKYRIYCNSSLCTLLSLITILIISLHFFSLKRTSFTVVGDFINTMKMTFDFNFDLYQAAHQHEYTYTNQSQEKLRIGFPFFRKKISILEMEWSGNLLRKLEFRYKWKPEIFRFTSRKPEKFPFYGMETVKFPVSIS